MEILRDLIVIRSHVPLTMAVKSSECDIAFILPLVESSQFRAASVKLAGNDLFDVSDGSLIVVE